MKYTVKAEDKMLSSNEPFVETFEVKSISREFLKRYSKKFQYRLAEWLCVGKAEYSITDEEGNKIAFGTINGSCFSGWQFTMDCDRRFV